MQSKEPFLYELKTFDGRSWPLTQSYYNHLKQRLAADARVLELPDTSIIASSNIKGIEKRQITMADMLDERKALPRGETKFDPNGPGYKKFLEVWKRTSPKSYSEHLRRLAERENETSSDNK